MMPLLDVLHIDPAFVVVNKASGLLSVPGRGLEKVDSVTHRVKKMFPGCIEHPSVHRLDMDTSGLMVIARTVDAQRHLSRQFQERRIKKRYEALLEGVFKQEKGVVELPFRLDVDNRPIQIYDEVHGKMGITHWKTMGVEGEYTRISMTPITGRTHQLRLHTSHIKGLGIPIVGDPFYGNGTASGQLKLHACELAFTHPESDKWLEFKSPPPF